MLSEHEEGDDPLGYMVWPWPSTQHGYEVAGEAQGERVHTRQRFRTPMHEEVVPQRVIAARLYTEPLRRPSRVVRAMRYGLRPDGRDLRRCKLGQKKVYHPLSMQWLRRAGDTFSWDSMVGPLAPLGLGEPRSKIEYMKRYMEEERFSNAFWPYALGVYHATCFVVKALISIDHLNTCGRNRNVTR